MGLIWWVATSVVVYMMVRAAMKLLLSDTNIDLEKLGRWAIVAGATDGIGTAFTHELAKKGFNVLLISKDAEKLGNAARFVEEKFKVKTKTVNADFTDMIDMKYVMLQEEMKSLDVGVLVNNVEMQCPHPEYFIGLEARHSSLYTDMLYCNIWALVNLTRFVLPGMVEKEKGLIINVSSLLHDIPAPLDALYAATKAFVTKFSKDLDVEYRDKGVHVHVLNAGIVQTQWVHTVREVSGVLIPGVPTPNSYVKSALVSATRERVSTGHIYHTLVQTAAALSNHWLLEKIMFKLMTTRRKLLSNVCEKCAKKSAAK